MDIFEKCNKFLSELKSRADKFHNKSADITKLFCIGYIKSFCYIFIKMHDKTKFKPEDIIHKINECDEIKMVKLYIYKIIYNLCNKQMHVFLNDSTKTTYRLNEYDDFNNFIKFENDEQLSYQNTISDNDNYKKIYKNLANYQKVGYKEK